MSRNKFDHSIRILAVLQEAGWERNRVFDVVYNSGPTNGKFHFTDGQGRQFEATAGVTPHLVCLIQDDMAAKEGVVIKHAWVDPATSRLCFHDKLDDESTDNRAEIMCAEVGIAFAQKIAGKPGRISFDTYARQSLKGRSGPGFSGGF